MQEIKLYHFTEGHHLKDQLHKKAQEVQCGANHYCTGSLVQSPAGEQRAYGELRSIKGVKNDAMKFFKEYFKEHSCKLQRSSSDISISTPVRRRSSVNEQVNMWISQLHNNDEAVRMREVMMSIEETGTYTLTEQELSFGAKLAWRNASRCIGRKQWLNLKLFDFRHVKSAKEIYEGCLQHLQYASNDGLIRSTITVFKKRTETNKETRIWNNQLIRYAGYLQPDGSVIGDPDGCELTQICQSLGWKGKGSSFEVLPLVIQYEGGKPELFEIPEKYILRIKISHPSFPKLAAMGLEWYGVPAISNMALDVGGLEFTCSPFNGWYMVTEISVRNFLDKQRFDLLKPIATAFDFSTSEDLTLWKDRTAIEMTAAVLHSFKKAQVTISDHHSLSDQFCEHLKSETKRRGGCPADWVWIVPPISGSLLPVFHQEMVNYKLKPTFEYMETPWKHFNLKKRRFTTLKQISKIVLLCIKIMMKYLRKRPKLTVLYGTESGRAKRFARHLETTFKGTFWTQFSCLDKYEFNLETKEPQFLAIVTSTFGNGEAPSNAELFHNKLKRMILNVSCSSAEDENGNWLNIDVEPKSPLQYYKYAIFGLGSSAYPQFCAFGHDIKNKLRCLGAEEIYDIGEGDELDGQEEHFLEWNDDCYMESCRHFDIVPTFDEDDAMGKKENVLKDDHSQWSESKFRIVRASTAHKQQSLDICFQISDTNRNKVVPAKVINVENLQTPFSKRKTNFIRLDINDCKDLHDYEIGDSLAVFPKNPSKLVTKVLKRCRTSFDPDEPIKLEINAYHHNEGDSSFGWVNYGRFSAPSTLKVILENLLDLTTPPSQAFLSLLSTKATHPSDVDALQKLIENESDYKHWKNFNCPTIGDVLDEFSSVQVSVTFLITQLPLLSPRYYSISSSPKAFPDEIHLTAALLEYKTQGGEGSTQKGVCTSWMDGLKKDDIVPCFIKKSSRLRLPECRVPMILVGPGTGIAPFRAFWQDIEYKEKRPKHSGKNPEVVLYTGCRNPQEDFLFQDEIQKCHSRGVLSKVYCAFSRVHGKPKMYVQHLMKQNGREIFDLLCKQHGHIFVCGGIEMARDVKESITEIIQQCQKVDYSDAVELTENLKLSGHYHEEVFGIHHGASSNISKSALLGRRRSMHPGPPTSINGPWTNIESKMTSSL